MRPLDRLFGAAAYPLDVLLPSAIWLALCAAALFGIAALMRRRGAPASRAVSIGLWFGIANSALYLGVVAVRALHEGRSPPWLAALEAPLSAFRGALDTVLWNAIGVSAAVEIELLFRGYSSWDGGTTVAAAYLLNEAALVALIVAGAIGAATYRAAGRSPS